MHSSTSSSSAITYVRSPPELTGWRRILVSTIALTAIGISCTEFYARSNGYPAIFVPSPSLWATQWYRFEESADDQTVIIGASRSKFGIVMDVWEQETNARPIMIAWPGSAPHPVLHLIAEREDFRGTVICGIAPSFSFAHPDNPHHKLLKQNLDAIDALRYSLSYHIATPVKRFLKHRLFALNEAAFSPIHNLRRFTDLKNRDNTLHPFLPIYWMNHQEDLQSVYLDSAASNDELMGQVKDIWHRIMREQVHYKSANMNALIASYVEDVQRIEKRGGRVIFVRHPSTDLFLEFEKTHYPREDYFDRLCDETDCFGIHFEDYIETSNYNCPEWSHLTPEDAEDYTRKIIKIISNYFPDTI